MSIIQDVILKVQEKDAGQPEFHQAVHEVLTSLEPTVQKHPDLSKPKFMTALSCPTGRFCSACRG
jgi:glutamate dehydrogenase (NADP+)